VEVVATRTATGGSAPQRVREHSAAIRERLDLATSWRDARLDGIRASQESLIAAAKTVAEKSSR
jgi:argininosuccinate lyase